MTTRIFIVCGTGASSAFLAKRMRSAAVASGVDVWVGSGAMADVERSIAKIDVVLIGPHLAGHAPAIRATLEPHGTRSAVIPEDVFRRLDGAQALHLAHDICAWASPKEEGGHR